VPEQSQGVQAWDRYAGMNNNPVRYNDPSGHVVNENSGTTESKKDCPNQKRCGETTQNMHEPNDDNNDTCWGVGGDGSRVCVISSPQFSPQELLTMGNVLVGETVALGAVGLVIDAGSLLALNPEGLLLGTLLIAEATNAGYLADYFYGSAETAIESGDNQITVSLSIDNKWGALLQNYQSDNRVVKNGVFTPLINLTWGTFMAVRGFQQRLVP